MWNQHLLMQTGILKALIYSLFRKFKTLNILRLTMLGHISQYRLFKELLELHLFKGVAVKWSTVDHVIVSIIYRTLISWFPDICSWSSWDSSLLADRSCELSTADITALSGLWAIISLFLCFFVQLFILQFSLYRCVLCIITNNQSSIELISRPMVIIHYHIWLSFLDLHSLCFMSSGVIWTYGSMNKT